MCIRLKKDVEHVVFQKHSNGVTNAIVSSYILIHISQNDTEIFYDGQSHIIFVFFMLCSLIMKHFVFCLLKISCIM